MLSTQNQGTAGYRWLPRVCSGGTETTSASSFTAEDRARGVSGGLGRPPSEPSRAFPLLGQTQVLGHWLLLVQSYLCLGWGGAVRTPVIEPRRG